MSKNKSNLKDSINDYYTIDNFRNEIKSILQSNNYLNKDNKKFKKIKYNNNIYDSNEENNKMINLEIKDIKSENDELKYCLNSIIKILDKKYFKYLKISNINEGKIKNIEKEIINTNSIIKNLNEKIKLLDKNLVEEKNSKNEKELSYLKNELISQQKMIKQLRNEIINKNKIIENYKENNEDELKYKNELIEIENLNNEIENYKNNLNRNKIDNEKLEEEINQINIKIKEINEEKNKMIKTYENKRLKEENNRLKIINKELNSKYKLMLNLENKCNKLLLNIKQIKEENDLLKNQNNNILKTNLSENNIKTDFPNYSNLLINNSSMSDNNYFKTSPSLNDNIYKKNFPFDKMKKIKKNYNSEKKNNMSLNNEKISQRTSLSSLIISDTNRQNNPNINDNNDNINNNESKDIEINENFNLYKPIKEGLLVFNLLKKIYYIIIPEKYAEFWEDYQKEGSLLYNTLEGLFLINAKNNLLYYYSSKKNIFCDLLTFKENHSYGCLFVDNLSKNIIAIGGKFSKLVELFSFENGKIEDLPQLSTYRSKITCCQVNNKIYCLFGICDEKKDKSLIEYLDLDKVNKGWIEVDFINNMSFNILTCMSCVNLNDSELLIIGGKINDGISNEKMIYFNLESKELFELDKDLPESDNKTYLFTENIMFNLFLNGNTISFINIDDNNQVHIIDNDLKYDLYLAPNL